jgi:hypothetical protein
MHMNSHFQQTGQQAEIFMPDLREMVCCINGLPVISAVRQDMMTLGLLDSNTRAPLGFILCDFLQISVSFCGINLSGTREQQGTELRDATGNVLLTISQTMGDGLQVQAVEHFPIAFVGILSLLIVKTRNNHHRNYNY